MVITVAWEISWYQYRVTPESSQPVRLAERGHDLDELEGLLPRPGTRSSRTTAG